MSLSTTAFSDRIFPPGSLEWQQQERLRRIQRIQQQREHQRLQSLFLREIRLQQAEAAGSSPRLLNNNTTLSSSGSVALKKTTSAKLATNKSPSVNPLKRSKSSDSKASSTALNANASLSRVGSKATVPKKSRKAIKAKSKVSARKVSRKSSKALRPTARKSSSTTARKSSSTTARKSASTALRASSTNAGQEQACTTCDSSKSDTKVETSKTKVKDAKTKVVDASASSVGVKVSAAKNKVSSSKTKVSNTKVTDSKSLVKGAASNADQSKVSFSGGSKVKGTESGFYCPVTTPVSILKNRKKMDDLCKTTLKPSVESKENFIKDLHIKPPEVERIPDSAVSFKPFPPMNPPPQPDLGVCKAFPGTKEWDEYWTKFSKAMSKYNKDMTAYEQQAAEAFKEDLARYSEQNQKLTREREIYKSLGAKGVELGLIPPPPITSKELKGLQLFNGYIMKSKGIKGTASNLPGSPTGVRFEVDIRGAEPENVLIQKDHNLLTISMDPEKFLRIGTPSGKLAGDIQVWPPIDGIIMIDAP